VSTQPTSRFAEQLRAGQLDGSGRADGRDQERGRDYIQSLERGLAVIRSFTGERPALSISEVAERTGVSRATARRILFTLERLGYVGRLQPGLFRLQPAVLTLGYAYISGQELPQVARPYMEAVAEELQGSCSLAALDGTDVIFVARVRSRLYLATTLSVGSRLPAHITAMGRVLLADLPDQQIDAYLKKATLQPFTDFTLTQKNQIKQSILEARRTGYSFVDQELETGLRSIAVPVHGTDGTVIAAMNVSVHVSRGDSESVRRELLPPLMEAARAIEADLASGAGAAGA